MGGAGTPVGQDSLSWDQVYNKLTQFFNWNTSFDTITDWISVCTSVYCLCSPYVHRLHGFMSPYTG